MPTKKKSPKPKTLRQRRETSVVKLLTEAAGLVNRVKALEGLNERMRIVEILARQLTTDHGRLRDKVFKMDTAFLKAEHHLPSASSAFDGYRDTNGRMLWWNTNLMITRMDDIHLENAIAYVKRGAGPFTDTQRADRLEALTFEAGRRAGKKGL